MTTRSPAAPVLDARALNRSTLARQHLLERVSMPALELVDHLVGLQAQTPGDPYVGMWSRLAGFHPAELSALVVDRSVVRLGVMRTTLHLVTADDALALRTFTGPVLERAWKSSAFARNLRGVDVDEVRARGRAFLERAPATTATLGRHLGERWPDADRTSLAYALRFLEPIVQVPPRGTWGASHQATWTTIEAWLGRPIPASVDEAAIVLRYLAAFGPASVLDIQAWCWRTKLGEVVETLRPHLVTFRDEPGRELFDLPDAPRPPADTPAPVRFLPEFDNVLLSHRDRSRFVVRPLSEDRFWHGSVVVNGLVRGTWRRGRGEGAPVVEVGLFDELAPDDADAVDAEATSLAAFLTRDAQRPTRITLAR